MNIERTTQQSLEQLSTHERMRLCTAVSFFMVLKSLGALPDNQAEDPHEFLSNVDIPATQTPTGHISRPAITSQVRDRYGISIVSWQTGPFIMGQTNDYEAMRRAGYIKTDEEETYFKNNVETRTLKHILESSPVIVTVKPGFAENGEAHSVIITGWDAGKYTIIDPDNRNPIDEYEVGYFHAEGLDPDGACTVIF